MSENKQRLTFVTIAQLFCMILIVLSHSVPSGDHAGSIISHMIPYLQHCGLTVFMTLSGFLVSYTRQIEKYGYRKFLLRRTARLLIPYVAVSTLMLIPKFLIGKLSGTAVSLRVTDILYQIITPREGILPHLWFLLTLWILCATVPLFMLILKNKWATFGTLLVTLVLIFVPKAPNILAIGDVQIYAFWFFVGLIAGEKKPCFSKNAQAIYTLFIIGGYAIVRIFWEQNDLSWFLYSLFCLIFVLWLAKLTEKFLEKICAIFGKYSFPIYILSLPVQNVADVILNMIGVPFEAACVCIFLLGLLIPVIISIAVEWIDRIIRKKIFGVIIGL